MQVLSMSHVHIIGPRGTGKTTLANALVGAPAFPYFAGSPQPPPTVSISHVALTAPAKNRAFESSIQFDGQPREMPNHSGSLSLQLEALAGNDAVARIDVALATDGATAVTECHGDEQQPHQQTPLRILVVRWDHLEIDADKYLRGSFRNGSLLVVNVNQPETSLTLDEIRALSSTRLGVEHRSVFALNCRLALASVLLGDAAPAATVPHQGVLSSLLNKIGAILPQVPSSAASSSALAKPSVPATAGPRYRVESAASAAPPSGATSAPSSGGVDRYTPVALQPPPAELFAAPTWREVVQPVRHSDSADDVTNAPGADRYELAVQRDARSVVESLVGQQYVPRHAAATASV